MPRLKKILVFRSGLLGDTLVGLPALWTIRRSFPEAHLVYVSQTSRGPHVRPRDVLDGSNLIDEFREVASDRRGLARLWEFLKFWWFVRTGSFDAGIVLEADHWSRRREQLLRSAGIPLIVGPQGGSPQIRRDASGRVLTAPQIADELLALAGQIGAAPPPPGQGLAHLPRTPAEVAKVDAWIGRTGIDTTIPMVAVAPGSNMPSKRWPTERFIEVIRTLLAEADFTPVILGGPVDRPLAESMIDAWGCGAIAAGELSVREGIDLLSRCALFIGNDTGTMHMAATAGIPCVAVFAAIDMPGRWEPYGNGHVVLRRDVECAGCMLRECGPENMRCLTGVSSQEVVAAARSVMARRLTRAEIR